MSTLKIAAITNDGTTITSHFGMAEYYRVVTIENGKVIAEEQRPKPHHAVHPEHNVGGRHEHQDMYAPISDCQVLLARGMGAGAYEGMRQAGIHPIVTDIASIDEAVQAYLTGRLVDHIERLH